MTFPLVRDLADDETFPVPVAVTCRVLGFSRQVFYAWDKNPVSDRDLDDAYLTNAAIDVHADDLEFGYRFVADELAVAGHVASERRVWRLCSEALISSAHSRKRGTAKRPGPPVHDDLVQRDFTAYGPNELWLTDITEHRTDEGELYLCAIKDVYSTRIVGHSIDSRMKTRIAVNASSSAVDQPRWPGARSTPTWQPVPFQALRGGAQAPPPDRLGAAGDNAAMESFFALLQKNVLNRQRWRIRDELRLAIVTWIERTYHRRRRQRALGKLTPIEFETI
jgi:putative transposase